jgi:hypothetical protein
MNSDPFDDALNNKKVNAFIVRWEPKIRERVGDRSVPPNNVPKTSTCSLNHLRILSALLDARTISSSARSTSSRCLL